jgi:DNA-directed RNA polymerase subunit RPC12/RpoP
MSYVKMRQFVCFECGHEEMHFSPQCYLVCPECFEPELFKDEIIDENPIYDFDDDTTD